MSIDLAQGRVQRLRQEVVHRELQVLRVESPSPHMRAVTFAGAELAGFHSPSFDDHVKFIFGADAAGAPLRRDYTPRRHDAAAGELTLEFALHGDGPGAAWAAQAAPGQNAVVAGPRGSFVIPLDYDWHVLAGDATALPAIARRLEELPAGARVSVLLQLDAAERRPLASAAAVALQWLDDEAQLLAAARALALPPGDGYVWCAGEAGAVAALRRIFVEEKGLDRKAIRAAAYWKRGAVGHHENLDG
ncbi:siderophore-interacting protein [Janthinobacterium fluminis]|uniref:Siderophore-interacting protein n=1 Tax=Janthinobacterium fluminis TaxID=2987524 RepID=A0ABT5JZW9_9BURK|nr:siderophore-interacting protein [Janthinobacterium fluminis]MDC8758259.1 siderophore-interacting protein [Janthinobacterium fluminis]